MKLKIIYSIMFLLFAFTIKGAMDADAMELQKEGKYIKIDPSDLSNFPHLATTKVLSAGNARFGDLWVTAKGQSDKNSYLSQLFTTIKSQIDDSIRNGTEKDPHFFGPYVLKVDELDKWVPKLSGFSSYFSEFADSNLKYLKAIRTKLLDGIYQSAMTIPEKVNFLIEAKLLPSPVSHINRLNIIKESQDTDQQQNVNEALQKSFNDLGNGGLAILYKFLERYCLISAIRHGRSGASENCDWVNYLPQELKEFMDVINVIDLKAIPNKSLSNYTANDTHISKYISRPSFNIKKINEKINFDIDNDN